jgi:hypothetical protein
MTRKFLLTTCVLGLLVFAQEQAQAQSWGRGGAYTGASPSLGYYGGRGGGNVTLNYKEPCWSAASSKCAREQSVKPSRLIPIR